MVKVLKLSVLTSVLSSLQKTGIEASQSSSDQLILTTSGIHRVLDKTIDVIGGPSPHGWTNSTVVDEL